MTAKARAKSKKKAGPAELLRTLRELFDVMPSGARTFYIWYSIATGLLGLLETAALTLMILVISPIVSGTQVEIPILGYIPESWTPWMLLAMALLFIVKGLLALTFHWFATRRFAGYELEVGDKLFRAYTRSSWEARSQLSTAEVTRIVDSSMANTNLGFILPLSQVPGNAVTFITILLVVLVAQPWVAIVAVIYLGLVAYLILNVINRHSSLAGNHNRRYAYKVATIMTEMVDALKEVTLRNKLDEVGEVVNKNRRIATRARANISFLGLVPKYAMEAALIGGFVLVGGFAMAMGGIEEAVFSIALFGISGLRMVPALNSVQANIAKAAANQVYAQDVIRELSKVETEEIEQLRRDVAVLPQHPKMLMLEKLGFRYPNAEKDVLADITLQVPIGSTLAIVGPSGAGKSTLVDILLGLSIAQRGSMTIDGIPLQEVMGQWRARVGYVPQRVALFDASVAQNVALTWTSDFDEAAVLSSLEKADLTELSQRGRGIHERIGERGSAISGGQQQRMGIARALYSDPLIMVMDEATSALDTATEKRVTESLERLQGDLTFITVAHRLATIRNYDQICYLDDGRILGRGTFDEVVQAVPAFAQQAALAGLLSEEDARSAILRSYSLESATDPKDHS